MCYYIQSKQYKSVVIMDNQRIRIIYADGRFTKERKYKKSDFAKRLNYFIDNKDYRLLNRNQMIMYLRPKKLLDLIKSVQYQIFSNELF